MLISLPWPDKRLSPNARLHWRAKVGPKQSAKIAAGWATYAAKGFHDTKDALASSSGPVIIFITFYPPDRRSRDDDNMIGAFKAARDAIADALGIDDRRFRPEYRFRDAEKPGRVEVEFPYPVHNSQLANTYAGIGDSATKMRPESTVCAALRASPPALDRSPIG